MVLRWPSCVALHCCQSFGLSQTPSVEPVSMPIFADSLPLEDSKVSNREFGTSFHFVQPLRFEGTSSDNFQVGCPASTSRTELLKLFQETTPSIPGFTYG